MPFNYERRPDDSVVGRVPIGDATFFYKASDIRKERTGIHAKVLLAFGTTILGYDTFNISRSEDRGRLANAAHKMLPDTVAEEYPNAFCRHDLDIFCDGLWDAYSARNAVTYTTGNDADTPPDWMLHPFIIAEAGTILFGPPEQGKSWTAMLMAATMEAESLDRDSEFWTPGENAKRPLFVNLERSESSVARRLRRVNISLGLPATAGLQCIHGRGQSLSDVAEEIRKAIREKDAGISCVFLDSLSRAGYGDLNDNQTANRIIDVLNGLGISWLALAHSPRGDNSHAFGSVMQDAGADIIVKQAAERKEDGTLLVALEMTKGNDVPRIPRQFLAYSFHKEYGLSGVRPASQQEFTDLDSDRKPKMHDAIRAWLDSNGQGTATEIAKALGFNLANVSTHLSSHHLDFERAPKVGTSQPYRIREVMP